MQHAQFPQYLLYVVYGSKVDGRNRFDLTAFRADSLYDVLFPEMMIDDCLQEGCERDSARQPHIHFQSYIIA